MKKLFSLLLGLGLAAALSVSSLAAGSAEIIRAFVYEGTLYTYVSMEGIEKPVTKAEARLGSETFGATDRLETVRQAGDPVTWLVLVDNSTSMPAFRQEVSSFAGTLAQNGGEKTRFILATFGDAFAVVDEDVPTGELAGRVETLPCDERVTRLHTAISQALDYFEALPREGNELRCLVLLSDAVQYDPQGGVPYEELLERMERSDVMFHSVGLGTDQASLDSMGRLANASGGLHQPITPQTAEDAAQALAEESGGLYVTGFDLSGYSAPGGTERVSVTFASGGELLCRAETEIELPALTGDAAAPKPEGPDQPDTPDEPDAPREPDTPDRPGAPDGETPSVPPAPGTEEDLTAQIPPAPAASSSSGLMWILIAAAVVVLAAVIAALLVLRSRKKPAPAASPAPPEPPDLPPVPEAEPLQQPAGIYMRLTVTQGALVGGEREQDLNLTEELIFGCDPSCGVVLPEGQAASRHARVFVQEGAVYVEPLEDGGRAEVNGETLAEARRLRSGDEIGLGETVLCLRF